MSNWGMSVSVIDLKDERARQKVERFLARLRLDFEPDVEYTLAVWRGPRMIGTGSFSGKVIKCVGIDPNYQEEGIAAIILTRLLRKESDRGINHTFVFTRPQTAPVFLSFGYREVARVEGIVTLLEKGSPGVKEAMAGLAGFRLNEPGARVGAVVVNGDPFTIGHRYLIEKAAQECNRVHVFVASEGRSVFPAAVRLELVRQETRDLENVVVHTGGDYLISLATFPGYFTREEDRRIRTHAMLDTAVFARHFVPALGITRRYIGEEPFSPVTRTYNEILSERLPKAGAEAKLIPRLEVDGQPVSASTVRQFLKEDRWEEVRKLVPATTYGFLLSGDAVPVLESLRRNDG